MHRLLRVQGTVLLLNTTGKTSRTHRAACWSVMLVHCCLRPRYCCRFSASRRCRSAKELSGGKTPSRNFHAVRRRAGSMPERKTRSLNCLHPTRVPAGERSAHSHRCFVPFWRHLLERCMGTCAGGKARWQLDALDSTGVLERAWSQQQVQLLQWPHPATGDAWTIAWCLPSDQGPLCTPSTTWIQCAIRLWLLKLSQVAW